MNTKDIKRLVIASLAAALLLPFKGLAATVSIEDFTIKGGETQTMLIDVNNPDMEVTMVEFYMQLPQGLSVPEEDDMLAVDIVGRTTMKKHALEATLKNDGSIHVLLYSGRNNTLEGTSGAVISVTLTAAPSFDGGSITLVKQLLTAPDQTESKPADYTYTIPGSTPQSDAVTIKAMNYTREYGEANPTFGYEVTSGTITSGTPTITCSATKTSPVGTYPIVISQGSVSNSNVTLVNGTLTITKASLTISAGNYTKQEGEANPTFTPTLSGFKNNETKSVLTKQPTVTCSATTSSPAGTYPVTVSGAEAQNYSFNYVNGTLTVTKKDDVTLTAKNYTREYGEENPTFGYEVTSGTITSGTPTITCSATKTSPVGTYPIVISQGSVSNSNVTLENGTLTITKATLTVSAGNYTKQEGEANPTFTPTFSGFKNNETKSVLTKQPTVSCSATTSSPAGTYPVTVSGADAQNYSFTYVNGTLTVTAKPVSGNITFTDAEVKRICVENWDTDGDGELSKTEAAAVTDIGMLFYNNQIIKTFNELQYFTCLTALKQAAFLSCINLTSVVFPPNLTMIGKYAFSTCLQLEKADLTEGITSIGSQAFAGTCITSVVVPSSVTNIEDGVYAMCNDLRSISVKSGNAVYDSRGNCNAVIQTATNKLVQGCSTTTIPSSVTSIGDYAFYMFDGITAVDLPTSVTAIGSRAYQGCSKLTTATIPAAVKSIGEYAFYDCKALKEVHSKINEPMAIDLSVFQTYSTVEGKKFTTATLYVPAGTKAKYQNTAGWKNFTKIVEMDGQPKGDVNGDNAVNVADIGSVIDVMAEGSNDLAADVNGDGAVNVADIGAIIDIMAGPVPGGNTEPNKGNAPAGTEAVDLGLPSGTLWANLNIGAQQPEDYGLYFAWGETTGYSSSTSDGRKFEWNSYQGTDNGSSPLTLAADAAHAVWGGDWVMPTRSDMDELIENTVCEATQENSVWGTKLTSKKNGKALFFPSAGFRYDSNFMSSGKNGQGYYWSSSPSESPATSADNLYLYKGNANIYPQPRCGGFTVRAVMRK